MEYRINGTPLIADVFLYVDAINGNDSNDGLTESTPLQTLESAFTKVNNYDPTYVIGMILGDGQYNNNDFTRKTNNTNKIMIIGNTNTVLYTTGICKVTSGSFYDPCKCVVEYYRLIWTGETGTNFCSFLKPVNFYNVVFKDIGNSTYGHICSGTNSHIQMMNCASDNCGTAFLRISNGTMSLINCIGNFTSGYSTNQSEWDTSNNVIQVVTYDSEYKPTNIAYEGLGTGVNPNGQTANIGVYGGLFAWGSWLKCLVLQNGKYYTIKSNALVEITNLAQDFFNESCDISEVYDNLNLLNDEFELIMDTRGYVGVVGNKSNEELIVSNNDFPTKIQDNIDYFDNIHNISGNGVVKVVFSTDSGATWQSYSNGAFITLNVDIPLKEYATLTQDELRRWNDSKTVILSDGILASELRNIDFNTINFDMIRFAYVLGITDISSDVAENYNLIWQFDAKGNMVQMKDTEYDLSVYANSIEFVSLIDNDMIKINVLPDGAGGGTATVKFATDVDIDKLFP